ncbi:MAG: hypothetical protein M3P93_05570, partial [Actinomycetota bacterium]|nr:hypothetical protein [Actinomycetota bacterium]
MSRPHVLLLVPILALAACTAGADAGRDSADRGAPRAGEQPTGEQPAAHVARPTGVTVVPGAGGAPLATATSRALFQRARVVVVAPAGDLAAQARASSVAVALGTPLLLSPSASDGGSAAGGSRTEGAAGAADTAGDAGKSGAAGATEAGTTAADTTAAEIERLGADTVLAADGSAARWAGELDDVEVVALPQDPEALARLSGARLGGVRATQPAG